MCWAEVLLGRRDILALDHVQHDTITVIIVTDIFLIKQGSVAFSKGVPRFLRYQSATIVMPSDSRSPYNDYDIVEMLGTSRHRRGDHL